MYTFLKGRIIGMIKKEDYEKWYRSCEFIREELKFYSFQDFMNNARRIKILYRSSIPLVKELYRWYVFANSSIGYGKKCAIWDYLNDYKTLKQLANFGYQNKFD